MGLFNLFNRQSFNELLEEYKNDKNAYLIDVREVDEYKVGHVPNSQNIPLFNIQSVTEKIKDKDTPIYVYCLSGARSAQAMYTLKRLGYTNVKNLGGIQSYQGPIQR